MAREWAIHAYKARLDSAIEAERWDEADRVRIAAKSRLLEMISRGGSEDDIAAARDALANSAERLRLSKRLRIDIGAHTTAVRLSTDAETAGIAAEQVLLPPDTARDVKERIIQILSSGNRRPWSTTELAQETARRVETVARAVSQLRADRKIISRRIGRYVLHSFVAQQNNTFVKLLHATTNVPVSEEEKSNSPFIKLDSEIRNIVKKISEVTVEKESTNAVFDTLVSSADGVSHCCADQKKETRPCKSRTFPKYELKSNISNEYHHAKR